MNLKNRKPDKRIFLTAFILLTGIYTIACGILFYRQAAWAEGLYYESDLPAHLKMAEDGWGYSLTAIIYRLFMHLPGYKIWVAVFLALCAGGVMMLTVMVLRNFSFNAWSALAAGIAANLVMPAFIKAVHYQRYVGYQSPSIWHNSTYTVMKFFSALTLVYYLRFAYEYKRKTDFKKWILFTVFLTLSTATKTSFLLVFAPVALLGLFVDIYRKVPIRRILLFASAILPSLAIVLLQEMVLYALGFSPDGTLLSGGKRLRPLFCCLCCGICSGKYEPALTYSAGLEMLHNFTLIHDDIEDNGDVRHNRPALWKRDGLALALNTGDLLYNLALTTFIEADEESGRDGLRHMIHIQPENRLGQRGRTDRQDQRLIDQIAILQLRSV